MGQYYRPIFLKEETNEPEFFLSPYSFDNGAKLMEHSYINNYLCLAVQMSLLSNPSRLVWAGDYADEEDCEENANLYSMVTSNKTDAEELKPSNFPSYERMKRIFKFGCWVVNHTKKVYFKIPECGEFVINPIPILCCEGNGRGGGDYQGTNMGMVGSWSRDVLEVILTEPNDDGYTKIPIFSFVEDYGL